MAIISAYVREDWYYSVEQLKSLLSFNAKTCKTEEEANRQLKRYVKELLSRNIIKEEKKKTEEAYIEFDSYDDNDLLSSSKRYQFSFVGIVICQSRIIYAYPKYIGKHNELPDYEPQEEMYQVIKVIEKYSKEKANQDIRDINLFVESDDNGRVNTLSVMLFLLENYAANGAYETDERIIEINGSSNILWQRTIDELYPIINDNRPVYMEMYTQRTVSDDADYFKRLHEYVVTQSSLEIEKVGLTKFFSLPYAEVSEDDSDTFGDTDYIVDTLDAAIAVTYDDRKLSVLRALKLYFKSSKILTGDTEIQLIGSRSFNLIWEEICAQVFVSQKGDSKTRKPTVDDIKPQIDYTIVNKHFDRKPPTLVELIQQPVWKKYGKGHKGIQTATLKPDYLRFEKRKGCNKYIFYILDAKYYCPVWTEDRITGQPGVEDVTKQYLYYLAYKDILEKYQVSEVKNYFLMPKRECDPDFPGYVKLDILKNLGLGTIEVRMLSPSVMYDHYLTNTTMELSELH